jgi:hypothetical protein
MAILRLKKSELLGAAAVVKWLQTTIDEEGMDRPAFRAIAEYIVSDLADAAIEDPDDDQGLEFILRDFIDTPPKLPNIMDLKGQIL